MPAGIGDVERGVRHAERIEQPLLQHGEQRLSLDDFDDAAEHVSRMAVFPGRAGLMRQWQRGDLLRERVIAEARSLETLDGVALMRRARRPENEWSVRYPAADPEIVIGRFTGTRSSTGLPSSPTSPPDLRFGEGRDVFRAGSPSDSLPSSTSIIAATDVIGFVIESDAEQRVRRHRHLRCGAADTERFEIGRLAAALHQNDSARNSARTHLVLVEKAPSASSFVRENPSCSGWLWPTLSAVAGPAINSVKAATQTKARNDLISLSPAGCYRFANSSP